MKLSEFKQNLILEVRKLIKEAAISVSRDELIQKIKDTKGAFFTVTFVKRTDGTTRTMNARFGVKKYLKGGELPYDPIEKGLLPVFDMQKNAYRMINTDTLIGAKIGNEQYIVK
jgi:hypothetical protein